VVENDQHDPHCPWFLIGVTAPCVLQSTDVGSAWNWCDSTFWVFGLLLDFNPSYNSENSKAVKSAY
jgi:hypothetical protein